MDYWESQPSHQQDDSPQPPYYPPAPPAPYYPPAPQPPYYQQAPQPSPMSPPYYTDRPKSNGYAIASLVVGIVSVLGIIFSISWFALLTMTCAVLAIVFAKMSRKKGHSGMATAGMVLGIISLVLDVLVFLITLAIAATFFSIFL